MIERTGTMKKENKDEYWDGWNAAIEAAACLAEKNGASKERGDEIRAMKR